MFLEPLPVDGSISDVRDALSHHRAVVVVADPGAGKTTRIPPALLDAGPAIVLQPRRAAARAIARRIAEERGWTAGNEVGWQVKFERRFSPATRLLIATEGILTARLQRDPFLTGFNTIVLDEFHERSIHADLAIALSKQAMRAREDLRLVVMSATLDAERVAAYLGSCPIVHVPGARHPLTIEYMPGAAPADAVARVLRETNGDVLCFQPGAAEISRTIAELRRVHRDEEILPLHGALSASDQDAAFRPHRARRVIVCTNIAETSVTVPGVSAVVDSGLEKVARYDAVRAMDSLRLERASQAAVDQRAGRAARTGPGVAVRLWDPTDRLKPHRDPEIRRVDLAGVALEVLGWGGDPQALDWFEKPRDHDLALAMRLLERLGATRNGRLTPIGRAMLPLPLPARLARVVVAGDGHRRAVEAAVLLAERPMRGRAMHATASDLFPLMDVWETLPERLRQTASQIHFIAAATNGTDTAAMSDDDLRRAVLAGYPDRVAVRREHQRNAFLLATGTGALLSDESGVANADFLVALDVQAPTSGSADGRIRMASAVERKWLEPTAREREHWVDAEGYIRAREVARYDSIVLTEHPVAPDPQVAAEMLAVTWLARERPDAARQLIRRLAFAGCSRDLAGLVRTAAYGRRSLDELDLSAALDRDAQLAIERQAPERLALPSGRSVRLEYTDDGGVSAAVKLQELFGLADTPRLGPLRVPVLFALLAPNGRPVQITQDLRSFWDRTYPEVRKELRGRYPKHPWPDDPWSATPTHRTKSRISGS